METATIGLAGSPGTFAHLMSLVLMGLQDAELFVYIDDIIVYSDSLKEDDKKVR